MDAVEEARRRIDATQAAGTFIFPGSDLDLVADLLELIEKQRAALAGKLDHQNGKVGRDHPGTSKRAATAPRFGSQRWTVLDMVAESDTVGRTAAEIADVLEMSRNQVATRLMELREAGCVARRRNDRGEVVERRTSSTATGAVHVVTDEGRAVLRSYAARRAN